MLYFNVHVFYFGIVCKMLYNLAFLIWLFIYPTSEVFEGFKQLKDQPVPPGMTYIYLAAAFHAVSFVISLLKMCLARYRRLNYHLQNVTIVACIVTASFHVLEGAEELHWFWVWAAIEYFCVIWCMFVKGLPMKGSPRRCYEACRACCY
jgi:hypothetical protein